MDRNNLQQRAEYLFNQGNYNQAIAIYEDLLNNYPDDIHSYCYLALAYLLQGDMLESQEILVSIMLTEFAELTTVVEEIITILDQEIIHQLQNNHLTNAALIYNQIKEINVDYLDYNLQINQIIANWKQEAKQKRDSRQLESARNIYHTLVVFATDNDDLWHNLALLNYELFNLSEAKLAIDKAIEINPNQFIYYYNAGLILEEIKLYSEAITAYQQAIILNPQYIPSYNNLGNLFCNHNQETTAEELYRQAISINPNHYGSLINLGNLLMSQYRITEALDIYKQAVISSNSSDIYFWVINNIRSYNYIQEAIDFANNNADLFADNILASLEAKRILPFIYNNVEEINYYRTRLTEFIQALLTDKFNDQEGYKLIQRHTNYHLHYQGKNDVEIQRDYGLFIQKVMSANYPQFSQKNPHTDNPKIRVGYISYCLRNHVVGRLAIGWLKNHNREKLEIYSYYLDNTIDEITREFQENSDKFTQFTDLEKLETICTEIIKDNLDILVFLDLGMYPRMTELAGLRLAQLQCVTWMHPITSGIPTIDYFISGELLEGENADIHYTETLVKLPNLGIYYEPKKLTKIQPNRSKLNLSETDIVYLSSQFPSKYLPQYDYLFPEIASQVKSAKFVFVHPQVHRGKNDLIYQQLWRRIEQSFINYNLNSQEYCLFLPTIKNPDDYRNLFAVADIFLDTIGFTGFNSTLDALESYLPVVTHCGEYFRTRQSTGILKMIRVTETIGNNEPEYINLATRLGLDREWRQEIVSKIKTNLNLLHNDREGIKGLEEFYYRITNAEPGT